MISLWTVLWAAPAAVGFAVLFNVHRRALPIVAVVAVLARLISEQGQDWGLNLIAADYLAAFVVGAVAYTVGPALREASPVFAFAPVIPLVPGAIIAKSFIQSFAAWITSASADNPVHSDQFIQTLGSAIWAAAILLALCLGAISPMLLLPRARTAED